MQWIQAGILTAQIIIAVVSYLTLHCYRVVQGLSTAVLRLPKGSRDDIHALQTEHIDHKFRSAK